MQPTPPASTTTTDRSRRGAGQLSTTFGMLVLLLLLLFAVQVMYDLYATSVVTGAGYDAARAVAGHDASGNRAAAVGDAEQVLRSRLGGYADEALVLEWHLDDPTRVVLRIRATHPSVLPPTLGESTPLGSVDRTIEVRAEEFR